MFLQECEVHQSALDERGGLTPKPFSLWEETRAYRINLTLKEVSDWGDANLVKFNAAKTQSCLFSAKKSPFTLAPTFRGVSVPISDHIELLGVNISSNLNFGKCIESKAKVAAKKLGILNKVRRYFTPGQRLALYQAQVRTCMEYCSHLWGGSAKYQLEALDSVDRRARRIIGDNSLTQAKLHSLQHRRNVACLSVFYRIYFDKLLSAVAHKIASPGFGGIVFSVTNAE
ncbi:jg13822 [Pararge aegeria aegeria]|uniref:Jg13822 protein n=1 Tax=Pararge aegeria aegeria TaxID=348720 RepID=A0A8S4S946_9NEOP|nr:jg13822 [Pararge aegeria aegeria]